MEIKHRTQLPDLLKHFGLPMTGVELGSAEGNSAFDFMDNGMEKLYVVDLWATIHGQRGDASNDAEWHNHNYEVAKDRLGRFGDNVIFMRGLTSEMAEFIPDNSVSLVYVDADHSENGVTNDINNYWGKLTSGGVMAFHDYENTWDYGVKAAVEKFATKNNIQIHLIPENNLEDAGAWIQKP